MKDNNIHIRIQCDLSKIDRVVLIEKQKTISDLAIQSNLCPVCGLDIIEGVRVIKWISVHNCKGNPNHYRKSFFGTYLNGVRQKNG